MSDARSDIFARIREALKVKAPKPHLKTDANPGKTSVVAKPWLPDGGETADASLAPSRPLGFSGPARGLWLSSDQTGRYDPGYEA